MAIIFQGVVIVCIGTFPGEHHFVWISGIPAYNGIIAVYCCRISNAHGTTAIAAVNFGKSFFCHRNGHGVFPIGNGIFSGSFFPFSDFLGASLIQIPFNEQIIFAVSKPFRKGICKDIFGQVGSSRSNFRQCGYDLILHNIAGGTGCCLRISV